MNRLLALAPCLILPNAGARLIDDIVPKPSRQHREAQFSKPSNDLFGLGLTVKTYPMYDCESYLSEDLHLDWTGPSAGSGRPTTVEYDYDMVLQPGSNPSDALDDLEKEVLRRVGVDLFSANCATNSDASERRLNGVAAIEEISSDPPDEMGSGTCAIPDANCHPVTGYITAYLSSSEAVRRLGEASVQQAITSSVQRAMQGLQSGDVDGVEKSYYIGDRDTFVYPLSADDSWWSKNGMYVIGAGVAFVVMVAVAIVCKRRRSKKKSNKEPTGEIASVVDQDVEKQPQSPDTPDTAESAEAAVDEDQHESQSVVPSHLCCV